MTKKYTVATIDRMRRIIMKMLPSLPTLAERMAATEDRLRTYMANGTDPEELEADAKLRLEGVREWEDYEQSLRDSAK
jgi:hypothetical protein